MEAAVLRVKRKRGAEPAGALLIRCKRPRPAGDGTTGKEETPEEDEATGKEEEAPGAGAVRTQLFRLAATVSSQKEPLQKYVQEAISRHRDARGHRTLVGNLPQIQKDLRSSREAERHASRYRLVSSLRPTCEEDGKSESGQAASPAEEHVPETGQASTQETPDPKGRTPDTFQVFDIEQEETERESDDPKVGDLETIMCNSMKMIRERLVVSQDGLGSGHRQDPEEFVYDIYYSESPPGAWIQDVLSVQPYACEPELMTDDDEPEEVYEDEDDENEEGNWRNDYPDEDEEECSDREERYRGYYEDSDEDRGHAWEDYCLRAGE